MEKSHKTLGRFLAGINLTEQKLKQFTGISIPRLRAIYKHGEVTDDELIKLVKALTARPAAELVCASQIGYINQSGIGNKQKIINNFITIIMRRLGVVPGFQQPHVLPAKPVLVGSVQQGAACRLPGSQVSPVRGVLATDNRGF